MSLFKISGKKAVEIDGKPMSQRMFLAAALLMLVPIFMVVYTLLAEGALNKWGSVVVSGLLVVTNLAGIKSYSGVYDRFLVGVSVVMNILIIWAAFSWL